MLTIFAVPKAFNGHIATIQRNAIYSWTRLRPVCEIILLGEDKGTAEISKKFGLRHIPDVQTNEYGTPLLNSIFTITQQAASNPFVCYINADIILLSDFLTAFQRITMKSFVMMGQRWNIDINEAIDFNQPD